MNKPVVICVDNEPIILDILEIQIQKCLGAGYLIETATGGKEALEVLEEFLENNYEVPLVIADCLMPDIRGDELLRRIHIISPQTIKIMLTGQADVEAVANAINYADLYRYISKPWQDKDLKLTVQEAIRRYFQEKKLAEQNVKLAQYNQNLEQLVKSRTQELEEKNQQLLASEKKYRHLVETSQDMIWSVDGEGFFTFVNQAVKQIYGYEPEEMVGRLFADFQPPEQHAKDWKVFQHILAGERFFQYETIHLAKDGRLIHLLFNAIALRNLQGNVIGTMGTASDITKRKQTEKALRESESMLRQITNTMPGVIYQFMLTPQGQKKYRFISQGAYKLLGYTAEQLVEDFALQWNQILPEDRQQLEESINASAQHHQPWFEEFRINHSSGQLRWIQGHSVPGEPLPDGSLTWTGTLIDISDRKQREEALRLIVEGTASKTGDEFFRSCVRYLAQLLHVRYALVTEWANPVKTRLHTLAFWRGDDFGENFEYDLANTPCHKVLDGAACYYPEGIQALFPNDPDLEALRAQSFLGIPLMNASGKIIGHLAAMDTKPMDKAPGSKDIPAERLYILKIFAARAGAELERKLAEDTLKQTAYAADAANHAKSEFLSRMSHELRTPLNAILGFTQVMNRNPSLSPEAQEHLGIISRSGEHLLVLINDILEMSKIESGIVTLNETSFDLYYLLDTLKAMFQLKAKFKDIELIFDRAPNVPQYVKTDESKLRQVLINLLSNAVKFTELGKVTLRVFRELKVERLKVEGSHELKVEGSHELKVERLKVEGSHELKVERLKVEGSHELKVEGSHELKVERLKVEGSHELRIDRLKVEGSRELKVEDSRNNLQPSNLQPSNLQPSNLQPSNLQPATLHFEVEDTGPGIAPEEMHLLFAPFEQTETGRKSQQGTGLGLPLTRQFVQLMGGDTTVSSTIGKGTLFKFDIPLCLAQSREVQIPHETRRVIGLAPDQPNYRILVVDDVKSNRLLLVKLLTSAGFEVREAINGLEAIALWESWAPHLIWMDMLMPVMDGHEATRQIKTREQKLKAGGDGEAGGEESLEEKFFSAFPALNVGVYRENFQSENIGKEFSSPTSPASPALPAPPAPNSQFPIPNFQTIIIALSANAFEEDRAVILSSGCDDFVIKPFQEETIFEKIARYLGVRYVYEKSVIISSEVKPQDEESPSEHHLKVYLSHMPAEWLTKLYQEAITGSDCHIFQLIEQIPSNYAPLRRTLMDWVNHFRFDRVIKLIQQAKK